MYTEKEKRIEYFTVLGRRLDDFGNNTPSNQVIEKAIEENRWFSREDILQAVRAIRTQMLDHDLLSQWLAPYSLATEPKKVGIIMAGNLPLVGFFDLLCVLISGHEAWIKPSSKDRILMDYIVGQLHDIAPELPIQPLGDRIPDAIIATGSNNTNRYFRSRYGKIPAILRGNRASAAVLSGNETVSQLHGLAADIFTYSGLGCRNVSHLLLPAGYDINPLLSLFSEYRPVHEKYRHNFTQRAAILKLQNQPFLAGDFFLLREDETLPAAISEITYHFYEDSSQVQQWLYDNDSQLQCVVGDPLPHPRAVKFGEAQSPRLSDYPDAIDVLSFLSTL